MTERSKVSEFELMAYADGLYDHNEAQRRRVEAHLRAAPEDAERVATWRAQNAAIRDGLRNLADEPLPARATALLDSPDVGQTAVRRTQRLAGRIAASFLFLLAGAGAGWLWSEESGQARPEIARFASFAAAQADQGAPTAGTTPLMSAVPPGLESNRRVAIVLEAPDLTAQGFRLVGSGSLETGGERVLRMTYRGEGGQRLDLLFRSRWNPDAADWTLATAGQRRAGAWRAVAVDVAVATDLSTVEAEALVAAIERSMAGSASLGPAAPGPRQATQPQSADIGTGGAITDTTAPLTTEPATVN